MNKYIKVAAPHIGRSINTCITSRQIPARVIVKNLQLKTNDFTHVDIITKLKDRISGMKLILTESRRSSDSSVLLFLALAAAIGFV